MAKCTRLLFAGVQFAAVLNSLTPAAAAEPAPGQAGATSRATLKIAVSVAPRAGVYERSVGSASTKDAGRGDWCAWSTSALRGLYIKFQTTDGYRVPPQPIRVEAGSSQAYCASNLALQSRIAELRAGSPGGAALVLVAPE